MWLNRTQLVGGSDQDVHEPFVNRGAGAVIASNELPWGLPIEGNNEKYAVTHSEVSSSFLCIYLSFILL